MEQNPEGVPPCDAWLCVWEQVPQHRFLTGGFDALQILKCFLDGVLKLMRWKGTWERTRSIVVGETSTHNVMEHSQISFQTETESCSFFWAKAKDLFQGIPALSIHNVAFKIFRSWSNNILASKAAFHRSLPRVLLLPLKTHFP